jgi:hypothetical protein
MLGSYWREHREIVRLGVIASGLLFAAVALYGLGVLVGQNLGYYDAQADGYAAQYPYDTDQRVEQCFTQSVGTAAKECAQDAIAAGRENYRDEQDLNAQRQMAKWALWLLIFTAGQSVLGFLGFLILIVTIRQGREANEIARQARRPWVGLQVALTEVSKVSEAPATFAFDYEVHMENTGQSAATDVSLFYATGFMAETDRLKAIILERLEKDDRRRNLRSVLPGEIEISPVRLGYRKDKMFVSRIKSGEERFVPAIAVGCCYSGPDSKERFKTFRVFIMHVETDRRDKCTYMTDLPATRYVAIPRDHSIAT